MTLYSINKKYILEPVQEWIVTTGGHTLLGDYYDLKNRNGNEYVRLYLSNKCAYFWEYYDNAEDAENARKMAILAKYGDIKRERARLYGEMRRLRDVINSWKEADE